MVADILGGEAERVAAEIRNAGGEAGAAKIDVTSEPQWKALIAKTLQTYGRLDILVNNAGIGPAGTIEKTSLEEWRRIHAVNLDGVFLGCKHAIPHLRAAGGGAIINMSSVAGLMGTPTLAAYGSSKGAVRQLTKSVALHCAARRDAIRCNSIHPVFAATPMVEKMIAASKAPEETRSALAAQVPLGRLAEADEVAALALYLASDEARFVTGGEFVIDGGITAR
jgi:NAD(P)-dependent dehydrogenase (short-subunit alcohol dehydrogenase family)